MWGRFSTCGGFSTRLAAIETQPAGAALRRNSMRHVRMKQWLSLFLACFLCAPPALPQGRAVSFDNSRRIRELLRAGSLYLSLDDAIALGIENNLDVELQRFTLPQAETELRRAQGGGVLRGLGYTLAETPAGVGGPVSPLVTNRTVAGSATNGTSVSANALELGVLGAPQVNYSVQGSQAQSNGTAVPVYDPSVIGQLNWSRQTTPQTAYSTYGADMLIANATQANVALQQGFATGGQAALSFTNLHESVNSLTTNYSPFTGSSLALNVTQPLSRGFGASLNRRYIRIAGNERKITSLLFQQQLILTVYGVVRLYTDFVALYEDVKVKQEAVTLAERLLSDTRGQVEEGALAPIELSRANAQLFSTRQDLINSRGLLEEQEAILKNVLTRSEDADVRSAHVVPTDTLAIPDKDEVRPIQDLISDAMAHRPDLGQARLQMENSNIALEGARSATRPEIDLVGTLQNNGLAGAATGYGVNPNPAFIGGYGSVLGQILAHDYPTYAIGLQVALPIHNRIAEADLARDELQIKQTQIRVQQLQNQARLEVEDALIAMRRARASYEAAVEARKYQQESLDAEQTKFEVGASTVFFVNQYESQLAQAKSAEVVALSSYGKAKAALQRATGTILDAHNVSVEAAAKGTVK
jgi:outer membrane protein TolC